MGATGGLMRYLRLVLIAVVLFGACSCSEVADDFGVSKSEQISCQAGPDCDLKWERAYKWVVENSGLKDQNRWAHQNGSGWGGSDASCHYHQKPYAAVEHLRDRLHWKMSEYVELRPFRRGIPHKICKFCFGS